MKLLSIDSVEMIGLVAEWLAEKENYQWLDFGSGIQVLTSVSLRIMQQRENHFLRV